MRKQIDLIAAIGTAALFILGCVVAQAAAPVTIALPDTVVRGAPESTHTLGTWSPSEVGGEAGWTCSVTLRGDNPDSMHPGSDLLLTTGGATLVAPNVENSAGNHVEATAVMILRDPVTAAIRLGGDGVFSGGGSFTFNCQPPPATTTTTTTMPTTTTVVEPSTTTTTAPESPSTTTTTTPAPVGPVPAGGGAMADVLDPQNVERIAAWGVILSVLLVGVFVGIALWEGWRQTQQRRRR